MVLVQEVFVLFSYWWKSTGLGVAKNMRGLKAGVSLVYSYASLSKAEALSRTPGSQPQDPGLTRSAWGWGALKVPR